jgi:hypothetical protein
MVEGRLTFCQESKRTYGIKRVYNLRQTLYELQCSDMKSFKILIAHDLLPFNLISHFSDRMKVAKIVSKCCNNMTS